MFPRYGDAMRIAPLVAIALVATAVAAHGCGGSKACVHDGDCAKGENCAYPTGGGCGAKGACKTWDNLCQDPAQPSCGCDGKTVNIGCGYPGTPVPVTSAGQCPTRTGGACATFDDCDPTALCAFAVADGCGAKGVCVAPDRTCGAPSRVACGCDGARVGLACVYGPGNAPAPVRSLGTCAAGDAAVGDASDAADAADANGD